MKDNTMEFSLLNMPEREKEIFDALIKSIVNRKKDTRTEEEIIQAGVDFIMGVGVPDALLDEEELRRKYER